MSMTYQLHHGDCLNIMPLIERESVDAVICDPPYGLGFMGKDWDRGVPGMHFWLEALRCSKPGAHLLAFGGTRTFHRLAVAIEDAGWEIRDTVMWVYGSGFPKSHDVSKAIDKEAGAEREVQLIPTKSGNTRHDRGTTYATETHAGFRDISDAVTEAAAEWDGWGTALKPAWEPIIVARKPLCGTVAENVQRYGTGAMNVDGCRIGTGEDRINGGRSGGSDNAIGEWGYGKGIDRPDGGRWPANLIHDGSAEVLAGFAAFGEKGSFIKTDKYIGRTHIHKPNSMAGSIGTITKTAEYLDTGSAARFFYCAKASKQDRDEGIKDVIARERSGNRPNSPDKTDKFPDHDHRIMGGNHHPTVKPTALMRYLCRLVTPPNGTILDPFMGSGSTGKAAMLEGFNFIGIDTEIEYVEIAARRIEHACEKVGIVVEQPMMFETRRETVDKPKQMILL